MTDVDELARIGAQLAGRVREYGVADNARWLATQLPDSAEWFRLAFVLAAAVPVDRSWRDLTAWTVTPARPEPAGTLRPCPWTHFLSDAGVRRHRDAGQEPCQGCRDRERIYNRTRKARYRAGLKETTTA